MILDHQSPDEIIEIALSKSDKELDKVYHSIPSWVNRMYPDASLSDRIRLGFEHQQKIYSDTLLREMEETHKMRAFASWLVKNGGLDFMEQYFKFIVEHREKKNEPST
jgi:hypothetical protein